MLVQTEPTPMLLPQAQPQGFLKFTHMTGTQSDVTPGMNQSMGAALPQNVSVRAAPDAISLPITVGPAVPLFAQKKLNAGEQGEMSQSLVRRGVRDYFQVISSMGQTFDGSRPLMDLSPLVALPDAVNGLSASQSLKLLTPQTPGAVVQQVPMPNARIEDQTNSDDEEEQTPETEKENINEVYPLIEFFPMITVKELHADLQGTVQENVWDLTDKAVGLIKGVERITITLRPNVLFPQVPQYNMTQDF
ncbi:hypothetical protein NDU88_003175 [Pleurodeles waltl]|uniref:Uncharacterized protein n=1 Tax=Pleurodeles waltl TaxID=8319 RepID=A0AAV7KY74_PLEWA|nr:hypothetical protein NDU88_003175 [Pleurodeles waltl]